MTTTTPPPAPTLEPYQAQVVDFLARPYAAVWLGIGYGKTLSTLAALMRYRPQGHTLVIAPKAIARTTWLNEINHKWQLPIRTKSLIADENDKMLSTDERLKAFRSVFTDPPTMYFINQELLTQTAQPTHLLIPTGVQPAVLTDPDLAEIQHLALQHCPQQGITRDQLIFAMQDAYDLSHPDKALKAAKIRSKKPRRALGVTKAQQMITALTKAGALKSLRRNCSSCGGDGCQACCKGLIDQMPRQRTKNRTQIVWPFSTIIIDESQGFASHASARFKELAKVRPAADRVIELTGTPTPNGMHDLWSQMYLLDQGAALGETITEFRRRYFFEVSVGENAGAKSYELRPGAAPEIYRAIQHLVISAFTTKLKLPPLNIHDVEIDLGSDLIATYQQFRRDMVLRVVDEVWQKYQADLDDYQHRADAALAMNPQANLKAMGITAPAEPQTPTIIAQNRAVLTSKLLQFASGVVHAADPDDPETAGAIQEIHDVKLETLANTLTQIDGPVLIAYYFRPDRTRIKDYLTEAGFEGVTLFDGSQKMLADWNAHKIPILLLHPASAGHGLNFQDGGSTMIWYTLSHSLAQYQQTNGRLYRTGQKLPVNIIRLLSLETLDAKLPGILAEKAMEQDELLAAVSTNPNQSGSQLPVSTQNMIIDRTLTHELGDEFDDALGQHHP